MAVVGIIQVVPYSIQQELLVYFPSELLNIITSYSAKQNYNEVSLHTNQNDYHQGTLLHCWCECKWV